MIVVNGEATNLWGLAADCAHLTLLLEHLVIDFPCDPVLFVALVVPLVAAIAAVVPTPPLGTPGDWCATRADSVVSWSSQLRPQTLDGNSLWRSATSPAYVQLHGFLPMSWWTARRTALML